MRTTLVIVLLLCTAWSARAQQPTCLDPSQSWQWSYNNDQIQSITYYLDSRVLSVYYAAGTSHLAANVPIGTAQRFQSLGYGVSPDSLWFGMRSSFLQILQAQDFCPLRAQNDAFLLSAPGVP